MDQNLILTIIVLLSAAFVPSIIYIVWIRNTEEFGRIRWGHIIMMFIWGAVFAVIIAVVLSVLFLGVLSMESLQREYEFLIYLEDPTWRTLIIVVVIAPIVEEFTKVLGLFSIKGAIVELEDGLVLGAASGLGFAATENLLYESSALFQYGVYAFIMVVLLRSVAATLLHGSASAVAGYGVSKGVLTGRFTAVPYYLVAVLMHAVYNYLASVGMFYDGNIPLYALIAAILFSLISFKLVRSKIKKLDKRITHG